MIDEGVKLQGLPMALSSGNGGGFRQSPMFPSKGAPLNYNPYPQPLAKYEDVVASRQLFMTTLEKLHFSMGTKFMIPTIGGKELDLHRLFVEVTSRGGIEKILKEKRWKEVTAVFSFPATATNASFVLRKYYGSLLHHYEQIYYFKARGCVPSSTDASLTPQGVSASAYEPVEHQYQSPHIQLPASHQQKINTAKFLPRVSSTQSAGSPVTGIIDGKFESGYLVTVTIGSERLKGVLYQAPHGASGQQPQYFSPPNLNDENKYAATSVMRRRRRKKSEMRRRDPAHPKPNRSGYNFFFAEQHARLKPHHPGKDRQISRIIGELWTNLNESEKAVYQEKAVQDKERYRVEMEGYRQRLKMGQIISNAIPIQQRLPAQDVDMVGDDAKAETEEGDSLHTPEIDSSGKTDTEDDDASPKDSLMEISADAENGTDTATGLETSVEEDAFELRQRDQKAEDESEESLCNVSEEHIAEPLPNEGQ